MNKFSTPTSEFDNAQESARYILSQITSTPAVGIILGTGQGAIAEHIRESCTIDYANIPHFPLSTVESHRGRLLVGSLENVPVAAMQGRFHAYEGYSLQQVTFPVRVMFALGIRTLIVCNACGGMNPRFRKGDVMIIDDHINLLGSSPLVGPNDERFGPRFPDMSEPYNSKLIAIAENAALHLKQKVHRGVYAAVCGPNLETRAEYRYLRTIGADVVGMSTVPEVIVARHMNMNVLGLSIITDECFPDVLKPLHLSDVLEAAAAAEPIVTGIIRYVLATLNAEGV